jgi:hypothetical protein
MRRLGRRVYKAIPGRHYDAPKELWGFRTEPGEGSPVQIAMAFLEANRETLALHLDPLFRKGPRIVHGLGAEHVIFQQRWKGRRVHRAYVTVHVGAKDRRVYLVKSRAAPMDALQAAHDARLGVARAVSIARARVGGRGRTWVVGEPELMWYPVKRTILPAWRVRVHRTSPRGEFLVYVNAETGTVIHAYDNLAARVGRGRVFMPTPMARDRAFKPLDDDGNVQRPSLSSYVEVPLAGLRGNGFLDGSRASTRRTRNRLRRANHDFRVDSHQKGFEEVSAYYHVDRSIAYLESLGYTGKRRIFRKPLEINARGTRDDDSWYTPGDRTLTFGLGDVDDAEDAEIVWHEFGHAIQDAICPDFGQSGEAAAMGEGFGDYWAASFFEGLKPKRYRLAVMSWDGVHMKGDPPCVRRIDSPHTFETFDHSKNADEHENGEIWAATLWEVRKVLGRKKADKIIVESHFQLDGFTTFARGARAIIDADHHLNAGRKGAALRRIFRRRGIGPVE